MLRRAVCAPHSGLARNETLSLQKSEGFRAEATGGDVVVYYCEPPATKDLESSGFLEE
jgi:hypothetical protein